MYEERLGGGRDVAAFRWMVSNTTLLSEGAFDADDGADEVVYTGVNAVVAVFVFGSDGVRSAVELCLETGFVAI